MNAFSEALNKRSDNFLGAVGGRGADPAPRAPLPPGRPCCFHALLGKALFVGVIFLFKCLGRERKGMEDKVEKGRKGKGDGNGMGK